MYQQEEQDKKMLREQEEQERKKMEELEAMPLAYIPLGWGDVRWESPDQVLHRRFELSLDTNGNARVRCSCVEQEGPRDMRRRITCDGRFFLPLTTSSLEAIGFVEGYSNPKTVGFTEQGEAEGLRPVAIVSAAVQPHERGHCVLTFKFLADRLAIRLDDGIVLTGWNGISVDIDCGYDDVFLSHISTENWINQILRWRVDDDNPIPCTCLLVPLSRKLQQLNDESVTVREEKELGLDALFAVEAEEYERHVYHQQQEHEDSRLDTLPLSVMPLGERQGEGECEYSLLFTSPEESYWVSVSEPYVPKFPTEKEIQERQELRKKQLEQVMEPITRPVSEPRRGWNYFMHTPDTEVTREAMLPMHEPASLCKFWTLSDKSESKLQPKSNLYPTLACLEWCNCSPSSMFQFYTLEIIVTDSLHSCELDISGFVAIRDSQDKRRNYIFNQETTDPLTVVSQNGVLLLPTMSRRRAIIADSILLEFDLKMKRTCDGIDSYQQLFQGVSEYPSSWYDWSRFNELSIVSDGHRSIPMMRLKFAMILEGAEATVELRPLTLPSQGIGLRCTSRTGRIGDDIVLVDGKYGGNNPPLQFVVAAEFGRDMEIHLEGVSDGVSKRWCIGFEPKFHALFSQVVDFQFGQVSLTVAWSQLSVHPTSIYDVCSVELNNLVSLGKLSKINTL